MAKEKEYNKLSLDRFVLLHFFLLFIASFVVGILFLHSTITFWRWQVADESATTFDNNKQPPQVNYGNYQQQLPPGVLTVTYNPNSTFSLRR